MDNDAGQIKSAVTIRAPIRLVSRILRLALKYNF
jgi:hypothetical protein